MTRSFVQVSAGVLGAGLLLAGGRRLWLHGVRFGRSEALGWLNNEGAFTPYDYRRAV